MTTQTTTPKETYWQRRREREAANPELRDERLQKNREWMQRHRTTPEGKATVARLNAKAWARTKALIDEIKRDMSEASHEERRMIVEALLGIAQMDAHYREAMRSWTLDSSIAPYADPEGEAA